MDNESDVTDDHGFPLTDPFNSDTIAMETVSRILRDEKCQDFVETGTYRGSTTLAIHNAFPSIAVWTVEVNETFFQNNMKRFAGKPIHAFLGDSVGFLRTVVPQLRPRPMIFLDAHSTECPLLQELEVVATVRDLRPIIMIHDFFNPSHLDFQFDRYHGQRLEWNYVQEALHKIYPEPIPHFHNSQAVGRRVGILYVGV